LLGSLYLVYNPLSEFEKRKRKKPMRTSAPAFLALSYYLLQLLTCYCRKERECFIFLRIQSLPPLLIVGLVGVKSEDLMLDVPVGFSILTVTHVV